MSYRVVQTIAPLLGLSTTTSSTTNAIPLKTGTLRVSTSGANANVAIGTIATSSDFHVALGYPELIKERVARQQISGITTGTSTVVIFGENYGNPFVVGDYVSIEGATTTGINTSYVQVTSTSDNSITINSDTSSVVGVITVTNATVSRTIKVSALGEGGASNLFITEVSRAS